MKTWFSRHLGEFRKRDAAKAQNYLALYEHEEKLRNFQHDHDLSGQRAHSTRPQDPQPRADAVLVHTKNDGSSRG